MVLPNDYVVSLKDLDLEDSNIVGEELASFGELAFNKIVLAPSFVITPEAFALFKTANNLDLKIKHLLGSMNSERHDSVSQTSVFIKNHIKHSPFPQALVKSVFEAYEKIEKNNKKVNLTLTAFYVNNGQVIKKIKIEDVRGEASLVEHIRNLWALIFENKLLALNSLTQKNHHLYSVTILVQQKIYPTIEGYIKTVGEKHEKHLFTIEAKENVKIIYNKKTSNIERGFALHREWKSLLSTSDIKTLIEIAQIADKKLYHPHLLHWSKDKQIFITDIAPVTDATEYYHNKKVIAGTPLHPGIRIGRIKIIDNKKDVVIANEEIVVARNLNKTMLENIKKASAIVVENDFDEELKHLLRQSGIPTIINAKDAVNSYKTGEMVSVDATNGFLSRGSILVS